ncbi:MAG: hypothetical protein DCF15_06015 [Phormidesmis priestleyi]|uniref:M23ase beta-sheet core domain-containing protein n=1 Tax=Phormidesmis priestleyi TaxID=268141 RepID=A0A2W4XM37_9CYAN|nr:MAG: hypothetical protein DCF15_06015 [Phormidesmis priestleyi]
MTFNSLPAYEKAGSIASAGDLAVELGYDPKRDWLPGDLPAEVFTLGDFQSSLQAEKLNLNQIAQLSGLDIPSLRIADIPFLQGATLSELLDAVPSLGAFTLKEIPALADIIGGDLEQTLAKVISLDSVIGDLKISEYLGDFSILEIPNLDLTALGNFANWQTLAIAEIPGLADIELGALSDVMATFNGVTAMHDVTYGPKEHRTTLTKFSITGSDQVGFEVQCAQERGCSNLELEGPGRMHGAQWIAGGDGQGQQMVEGGRGLLGIINSGEEPTGRHPFGKAFKIVLTKTTESKGTGEFGLYFNICVKGAFYDLGCTPYFLGPIPMPLLNTKEKGMVITGLLDGQGGATSGIEAPEAWEDLRPETPPEVADFIKANTPSGSSFGGGLCGEGPGGIDYKALADAYKTIESNIDNYDSVGPYTYGGEGGRGQPLWGYALGRYQYMTYREDIRAIIMPKAGGAQFLAKADRGGGVSVADLNKYFPPEAQDDFFRKDQNDLIKQAIGEGFEGEALLGRVGELHHGGTGASVGSKPNYSNKLIAAYNRIIASEGVSECGKSSGNFINPMPSGTFTSPYGWRIHPIYGTSKLHTGQDIGAPQGTPIIASDGGVVVSAAYTGGYGNFIIIEHKPGVRTRYAHLSKYNVKAGDQVSQGDVIGFCGSTGGSTGPHLHFEIQMNGSLVDPYPLVDW